MMRRFVRRRPVMAADHLPNDLHPVLKRVYAARGVSAALELDLKLEGLIPVGRLEGIAEAVDLLLHHHTHGGGVLVIGDFDADGATSTALVVRQLTRLGFANVSFMVPNRFQYGYGLTPEIVRVAAARRPSLILTVDNGISSHAGVEVAHELGILTLVTDHHLPGRTLPRAAAIVNPNVVGSSFPSKALAGVGVAFYLMAALTRELQARTPGRALPSVAELLDLVALGTVADLVALDHNNRILVHQGLRRIRAGRCSPGILALLEAGARQPHDVIAADLGFQVGPRLNAAGRLDDMTLGIQCLLADDMESARVLAGRLTALNHDRKSIEARMEQEALMAVEELSLDAQLPLGLCLYDENWHQGVVGLVASRLKDRVHRPVIALARADDEYIKGSARSVAGVHIRDVLDAVASQHPGMLEKFGGHAMAAGLTLRAEHLEEFQAAFDAEVRRWITPEDLAGIVHSDGGLTPGEFCLDTARVVRGAGPWGQGFPEPLFDGRFGVVEARPVGERHLKLKVRDGNGPVCDAIAFRHFDVPDAPLVQPHSAVDLAFRLDVNFYAGIERLQLVVEHVAPVAEG
jgi:single-stranded-DNA-specific exonuclease